MQKGIIGKKMGMTQIFDENGKVVPVTVVEAGPCTVVQKKTVESDGYVAVQLGYGDISAKKVSKPAKGHFDKADVAPKRTLREFRLDDISAMNVGDILKADVFAVGDRIDVVGTSKGKATPAPSSAGTSTVCVKATAPALWRATPVPWAPAPRRPACSRANACRAIWAPSALPSRTSRSSRLTQKII